MNVCIMDLFVAQLCQVNRFFSPKEDMFMTDTICGSNVIILIKEFDDSGTKKRNRDIV